MFAGSYFFMRVIAIYSDATLHNMKVFFFIPGLLARDPLFARPPQHNGYSVFIQPAQDTAYPAQRKYLAKKSYGTVHHHLQHTLHFHH